MRNKELLEAVKQHITENLAEYSEITLQVHIHNLPVQAVSDEANPFPFVIIRFDESTLQEHYTESDLVLALGVFEPQDQEQAGLLLAEVTDVLSRIFYEKRIVGSFFDVQLPIKVKQVEPERKWNEYHISGMELKINYNTLPPRSLGKGFENENEVLNEPI